MIDLMPKKLISLKEVNNWNKYIKNLGKLHFVKKYLGNIFKTWVSKNDNPMSITWLANLYDNNLNYLNNKLKKMEETIDEDILYALFNELKKQKRDPAGITTKIQSITGEIIAFRELNKKYSKVERMEQIGDWLCDSNTVVSVKTKNELDLNYQIIEDTLRSLYFIKENKFLRKYNDIDIKKGKNIDDKFRNSILWFINSRLIDFIHFSDNQIPKWDNLNLETTKYFSGNGKLQGYFEVEVKILNDYIGRYISLLLKEDHNRKSEESKHQIEFIFKEYHDKNTLGVSFDTNAYWINENNKIDWQKLEKFINGYLIKFDISYNNSRKHSKNFIGWINIIINPEHESYIRDSEELKKDIIDNMNRIGKREYRIIFAFIFKWSFSSKKNIIIFEV